MYQMKSEQFWTVPKYVPVRAVGYIKAAAPQEVTDTQPDS